MLFFCLILYLVWFTKFTEWNTFKHFGTLLIGYKTDFQTMSSKIEVQRICQHCGTDFTARTTVTKYCSHRCGSLANKVKIRFEKVQKSNTETRLIKTNPIEELKAKEFLNVSEVSKLIGCSRQNVYKLINTGKLNATNILEKKTIVRRCDLEKIFNEVPEARPIPEQQRQELNEWKQAGAFDIEDCYTVNEILEKFSISETALHSLIKRENIPKIKRGWYAYVPKLIIDGFLN